MRHYGVSEKLYNLILAAQDGVCAICRQPESVVRRGQQLALSVDHNHLTNEIRGLLCSGCNRSLGMMKENIEYLERMIDYIREYNGD